MTQSKKIIKICLGSSCHSRGSYAILNKVKEYVVDKDDLKITGRLCNDSCTDGPVIKINDVKYTEINENNIVDLLNEKL